MDEVWSLVCQQLNPAAEPDGNARWPDEAARGALAEHLLVTPTA